MANTELVPLDQLADAELRGLAEETHARVSSPLVSEILGNVMLHGVVARHSVSAEASYESLRVAQAGMRSGAGSVSAYAVRATELTYGDPTQNYIGMASLQPDLPLRRQSLPMPPPIARRLSSIAMVGPAFSQLVHTAGPNAVAWVDPRIANAEELTASAQEQLRRQSEAAGELWRLVPDHAAYSGPMAMASVMHQAGFRPHGEVSRYYDDMEVGSRRLLPSSTIYTAPAL